MICKYFMKLNGQDIIFDSEEELAEFMLNNKHRLGLKDSSLVSFSRDLDPQQETKAKILEIVEKNQSVQYRMDEMGNKVATNTNGRISVTRAITTPGFTGTGSKAINVAFNRDAYARTYTEEHLKRGETKEQIKAQLDVMFSNWKTLGDFGTGVHAIQEIMFRNPSYTTSDVFDAFKSFAVSKNMKFEDEALLSCVRYNKKIIEEFLAMFPGCEFIPEVKITATTVTGMDIVGKIDLLIVTKDGDIHIADFKTSESQYEDFKQVKNQQNAYQLLIYKMMLQQLGIDSRHSQLFILPLLLTELSYGDRTIIGLDDTPRIVDITRDIKDYMHANINKAIPVEYTAYDLSTEEMQYIDLLSSDILGYNTESRVSLKAKRLKPFQNSDGKWCFMDYFTGKFHKADTEEEINEIYEDYLQKSQDNQITMTRLVANSYNYAKEKKMQEFSQNNKKSKLYDHVYKKYLGDHWTLDEGFVDLGILVFINNLTKSIELVSIIDADLSQEVKMAYGISGKRITGNLVLDSAVQNHTLASNLGNIELMRIMFAANEFLKNTPDYQITLCIVVDEKNDKLATQRMDILYKNFSQLLNLANEKKGLEVKNNLQGKIGDSIKSLFDLVEELRGTEHLPSYQKEVIKKIDSMSDMSEDQKLEVLIDLLKFIEDKIVNINQGAHEYFSNMESEGERLLAAVADAIILKSGAKFEYLFKDEAKLSLNSDYITSALQAKGTILREAYRKIIEKARLNINKVANAYALEVKTLCEKYMKTLPIYRADSSWNMFDNLIETADSDNAAYIRVKNPYDENSKLSPQEKEFLKGWLELLNKHRYPETDGKYEQALQQGLVTSGEWFNIPLMRGGMINRGVFNPMTYIRGFRDSMDKLLNTLENLTKMGEERTNRQHSKFDYYINPLDIKGQDYENAIRENGINYFSRNLSEILTRYVVTKAMEENYNKVLPYIKAILVVNAANQAFTGNNLENLTLALVERCLVEIYKKNLDKSRTERVLGKVTNVVSPILSLILLAFNPKAVVRDFGTGFWNTLSRNAVKLMGNEAPSTANLLKAHGIVFGQGVDALLHQNMMNALNMRYNIAGRSNSEILESHRAQRSQFLNNFLFRSGSMFALNQIPDYTQRMTFFIAYLMEQGCYDAYSYNEETQELVYDFGKDKRWDSVRKHLRGETLTLTDWENIAKYKMILEDHNKTHDAKLKYGDALPDGIAPTMVSTIKNYNNQVFGNMDSDSLMLWRNYSIGKAMTKYTSYVSSKMGNWFTKPGMYMLNEKVFAKDETTGKDLYWACKWNEDAQEFDWYQTTDKADPNCTGSHVLAYLEKFEIGVWYALQELASICFMKDDVEMRKMLMDEFWKNDAKSAAAWLGIGDLITALLAMILCGGVFKYNEHMEELRKDSPYKYHAKDITYDIATENNPLFFMSTLLGPILTVDKTSVTSLGKGFVKYISNDNITTEKFIRRNLGLTKYWDWD